ncbi:MAG: AAA family ATPase [Streptosporangiaceae bacterium]
MGQPENRVLPGRSAAQVLARIRRFLVAVPFPVRMLLIAALCLLAIVLAGPLILVAIVFAPYAIWTQNRSIGAPAAVAVWGLAVVSVFAGGAGGQARYGLLALAPVVAIVASIGVLGRWQVPCRTTAWALAWSLPPGIAAFRLASGKPSAGPALAWVIAAAVLGLRFNRALQIRRQDGGSTGGLGALAAAPLAVGTAGPGPAPGQSLAADAPGGPSPVGLAPLNLQAQGQPAAPGHPDPVGYLSPASVPGMPGSPVRAAQAGDGLRTPGPAQVSQTASTSEWADITVDDAMAELSAMVGLTAVKEQVRSITASVEAARRRAVTGHSTEKPMQHFVFLGPPGTGKTAVARVIAKIFYAFGLLGSPVVVEAQRADLVGEYLGATAIKTNELVDSALGSVLFIDEAYSLVNEGDGQGDRFGNEAVQALVKRAEDDRDNLIIILAGYERQMESFLSSNPGLNSRFGIRVKFPGYSPPELAALTDLAVQAKGELLDPDARPVLRRIFDEIGRRRLADELGNGRFVRSLVARAGQQRDVRVMAGPGDPTSAELVTLHGADIERAYTELTARFRGYTDTPTVEGALAELDALVGLAPVKQQVHEIVAQLRVARLRARQGLASQPPSRHFVFTGPPGTGKTTVARIIGRIFSALGLLVRPEVIEAHRADLVGEHLGSTAIKTSKLIDSAMGGVLFIDEAYALHNEAYSGGDAFGSEAVATLLKRAEDDRERLVIVLAGYTGDMDRLLRSNPGLASRFSTRITFPSYSAAELSQIAQVIAAQAGDTFADDALPVLDSIFASACDQARIDALGNGRFARSLYERACASRDLRVSLQGEAATAADLTTVLAADVLTAYRQLAG